MVRKIVQTKIAQLKDEWAASGAEADALVRDMKNWTGTGVWVWGEDALPCMVKGCIRAPKRDGHCRKHVREAAGC
ncbi:hypothetical protein [Amycolatopsis sp. DSM 110486]|uniref:hypothetical protein n=1 Tax=Amycolatopsis sp. DSM 110486 TaxID=2865832 RepID=UPI001C69A0E1|nr:hypothetical protein [Amycolatopsis sp. DSM 110486]QYN23141.1 hypothetical protein K1T34_12185 [Amycolatopsis sp. DSM 110486]